MEDRTSSEKHFRNCGNGLGTVRTVFRTNSENFEKRTGVTMERSRGKVLWHGLVLRYGGTVRKTVPTGMILHDGQKATFENEPDEYASPMFLIFFPK